jgi:GNAT superfamily N-acetyltransferase
MSKKLHIEDDQGRAHVTGALNVENPQELLVGEIKSERKGVGIGTRLLRALESLGSSRGASRAKVVLGEFDDTDVDGLRRFYEKNGYRLSDGDEMTVGEKDL